MEKAKCKVLDEKLNAEVTGYNNKKYTLYELRLTANNYSNRDEIAFRKLIQEKHAKIYNCTDDIIPADLLAEVYGLNESFIEIWKTVKYYKDGKTLASNLGRIKQDGKIILQEDESIKGYLHLAGNPSVYSYKLIADAFYGTTNGKHIHHINNNGFDCRPVNLILLDAIEHSKAHGRPIGLKKEDLSKIDDDYKSLDPVDYEN